MLVCDWRDGWIYYINIIMIWLHKCIKPMFFFSTPTYQRHIFFFHNNIFLYYLESWENWRMNKILLFCWMDRLCFLENEEKKNLCFFFAFAWDITYLRFYRWRWSLFLCTQQYTSSTFHVMLVVCKQK